MLCFFLSTAVFSGTAFGVKQLAKFEFKKPERPSRVHRERLYLDTMILNMVAKGAKTGSIKRLVLRSPSRGNLVVRAYEIFSQFDTVDFSRREYSFLRNWSFNKATDQFSKETREAMGIYDSDSSDDEDVEMKDDQRS